MLADDGRARGRQFASQWLHLRNLARSRGHAAVPDFDDNLRQAFRQETELFVDSVLREDRSVLDLLARIPFVNERLAKHYGIADLWQPVPPHTLDEEASAVACSVRAAS